MIFIAQSWHTDAAMPTKEKHLIMSVTIKDCRVDTFASGGPGGQHQNKTQSGVRVTHPPSGAVGESRETRSQHVNKANAFRRMGESKKFQDWARMEVSRRVHNGRTIEQCVDDMMTPANIKQELLINDRWVVGEIMPDRTPLA